MDKPPEREGAFVIAVEAPMVSVDAASLRQVLLALQGPPHLIRELQAIRSLPGSSIDVLIYQFNAWAESPRTAVNDGEKPEKAS